MKQEAPTSKALSGGSSPICEYDTPKSIINEFTNIFVNNTFREFDDNTDTFVPIANREERKVALIKFFEKIVEDLKKEDC